MRRDYIILNIYKKMKIELKENYTFEDYRKVFYGILDEKKMNKTSERFNILREIYETKEHFNVEMLYNKLKNKRYPVSKTTLYNTLDLLESFHLIIKHQFGDNVAQYEKYDVQSLHDHLVFVDTGEITEFLDLTINDIIKNIEQTHNVIVSHRSFTLFCKKKHLINNKDIIIS
jgi:Fur family ferric uptake transcriptional regulator